MGIRALIPAVALGLLAGCAALPSPLPCAAETAPRAAQNPASSIPVPTACASAAAQPAAQLAAVQQTSGQTRTVGVPRGFLIAMIVLLVLMLA